MRIRSAVNTRLARAVNQRAVARRARIGVQRLQRVDQHTGNVTPGAQHLQAARIHVFERVGLAGRQRVARAGLNVVPPAVVSPAESHDVIALGVKARQPHGLHHGLGTRHVERDLIEPRDALKPLHVLQHARVVRAQHGAQLASGFHALSDACLVEVLSKEVHAVRTGQVMKLVAVKVFQRHAAGGTHEAGALEPGAQVGAVLKRHAVGAGELQVRDAKLGCFSHRDAFGVAVLKDGREPIHSRFAFFNDSSYCAIRRKEFVFIVGIARNQPRHALGHAGVARERAVLGARQFEAALRRRHGQRQDAHGQCAENPSLVHMNCL